jgi:hypothetical protein
MPDSPFFPSLDLELQQLHAQTPSPDLPNNNFPGQLQNLNSIYQQIAAYKSISPLLKKSGGIAKPGTAPDPFPSLSAWRKTPLSTNDVAPMEFDPVAENLDRYKGNELYANIGFLPGRDNEELYGRQQTTWDKLTNGVTGAFELAKFQFVDQLKGWGRLIDSLDSWDLDKLYDQGDMAMVSQKMNQIMNENPIFMTEKDRNSVFTASNFANIIQQSGFTLGALTEIVAEEMLLTAATAMSAGALAPLQGARSAMVLRNLGQVFRRMGQIEDAVADTNALRKVFNTLVKASPMSETATLLLKGARGGETAAHLARRGFGAFYRDIREMNAAFTESRAETSGTYMDLKDELTSELYAGNEEVTKEKIDNIEKTAREAADANFWANAAIISVSNRIQFDNVFRGFKGASRYLGETGQLSVDKAGFFKRSTIPFTKGFLRTAKAEIPSAPLRYFKNNVTEALQENLQSISNRAISAYYKANYSNPGGANINKAINDAISSEISTEGARTFMSGFLTAAITTPFSRSLTAIGRRISTTKEQRAQQARQTNNAVTALNGFFSQSNGRNSGLQASLGQAMGEAIKEGDRKGFQDLKDESVRQLVRTAMETGQIDAVFDRLDHFASNFTKEEFEKAFGIEFSQDNKKSAQDYINSLRGRAHQIKGIKEELDYKFPNPFDPSKAEKDEDKIAALKNQVAFENAKWQMMFMQDSHMRTLERQSSILRDLQQDMSEVSYNSLFPLTDEKRVRAEIKILREEAKVTNDQRLQAQKTKQADLLAALLPGIKSGNLHAQTFQEYINHIQEQNRSLPINLDKIQDNLSRFNDFFELGKDQKALFSNLNYLADPESWAKFVNDHSTYMEAENWFEANKNKVDEKLLAPIRTQFPDLDITMDDQLELQIKDKEGNEASDEVKTAVAKAFQDEQDRKQKEREEAEANDAKIRNRLAEIYQTLTTVGVLDEQDKGFIELVKDTHADDANYIKIRQFLDTLPTTPAEGKPPTPPPGPKNEQPPKPQDEVTDDDAAPYYEGSESIQVDVPAAQGNTLKTIVEELKEHGINRTPQGDVEMEGGYSWVKGELIRYIAENPGIFKNAEFVLQQDRAQFYEHAEALSEENKEILGVNHPKSPYSFWKDKSSNAVVLFLKDARTGEFIYVNPRLPGMVTDSKNGVVAMFSLDLKKAGVTPQQFISYVNAQANSQIKFSVDQVAISLGAYKENPGKLKSVRLFMEGVAPEDRPKLHISKAPKGKDLEWNDPENTRNGGVFLEVSPNMNRIKLVPAPLKDIRLSDGTVLDLKALFSMDLTDKQLKEVLPFVRKIIYQGNFRPPKAYTEQIIVTSDINKQSGKMRLKLVRMVDTTGKTNEKAGERVAPVYKDSGQSSDTILDYILAKRHMNVKMSKNEDITIPVVKDGKLEFVKTTYFNFLYDNLYTNKARIVHPDGRVVIHPVDNYLILPELKGMMETVKTEKKKAQRAAAKLAAEKMSKLKEGETLEPKDEDALDAKRQAELRFKIIELGAERSKEISAMNFTYTLPEGLSVGIRKKEGVKHVPGEVVLINDVTKKEFTIFEVRMSKEAPKEIIQELNRIQDLVDIINDKYEGLIEKAKEQALSKESPDANTGEISAEDLAKKFKGETPDEKPDKPDDDFGILRRIKEHTNRALIGNEELQFIKDRFGDAVLNHMAKAVNSEAWGYWKNGAITLFSDTVAGVGYHEAWHHFSQMFLTREQKTALYREARRRNPYLKEASDKQVEEFLADDFRDFKEKGTILGEAPKTRNIFQKILDFLRYLFTGNKTLEQYYNDLNTGELLSYKPSINNAMWGRLNYGFVTEVGGKNVEIFDASRLAVAQGFFNTMLHKAFARKGEGSLRSKNLSFAALLSLRGDKKRMVKALEHIYLAMKTEIADYVTDNQRELNRNAAGLQLLSDMQLHFDDFFNFAMGKFNIDSSIEDTLDTTELEQAPTSEDGDEVGDEDENTTMKEEMTEAQSSDKVVEVEDKGLLATLSKIVRNMVLTIPKGEAIIEDGVLVNVVPAKNEYGLSEPCNYYKVVNILGEELAGLFDDDKILAKLNSPSLLQRLPETKFILEALPDFTKMDDFAMQTLASIVRDFNRVYTQVDSLIQNRDGRMSFIEMTKNTERQIYAEWMDNFLKSEAMEVDEKTGNRYMRKDFVEQNIALTAPAGGKTFENHLLFLEKMGVTFSERTKQLSEFQKLVRFNFINFANSLNRRLQAGQNIENPMRDMNRSFRIKGFDEEGDAFVEILENEGSFIREMVRLESQNSDRIPNNMYKTAKGTNKYALMLPNRFNITMDALKHAASVAQVKARPELSYLTDPQNYYIQNSLAWRSIFNSKGAKVGDIDFGDYNSFKMRVYDKTIDKQTTELTGREKIIMNMNSLLLEGVIDIMRTGSSQSSYFYRINKWRHTYQMDVNDWETDIDDTWKLPFSKDMYEKGRPRLNHIRALRGYFFNLLVDELSVMRLSEVPSDDFQKRIQNFGVFADILSQDTKNDLSADTAYAENPKDIRKAAFKHIDKIMKEVNHFLDEQTKEFIEYAEGQGVTAGFNGAPSRDLDVRIHEMGLSWKELSKMFILNDFVLNVEYSRLISGVPQFYKDYHKRAQTQTSTGNTANNGPLVRDYLASTHSYTMAAARGKEFNPNIEEFGTQTTVEDHASLSESTKKLWLEAGKLMGKLDEMKKIVEQYSDINVNDGQAHATFDFYRRMRIQMGNWDHADEIEYTKEVYKWRLRKGLYSSPEHKKLMESTIQRYSDKTYSTFPVVKFQYEGPLKHPGIMIPVLHKFAVAPIIPSVYQDTDLEDMEEWMMNKNIDYITSISGSKNFNTNPLELWADPKKRQGWNVTLDAEPNMLYSALLKEQIKTGSGFKEESTWGTQLRSLFLSNAFNEGKSTKEIEELFDKYLGGLDKLIEIERSHLFRELGIKEAEDGTITISNTEEFVRTLQRQADVRNLNSNIKRAIGYDPVTGGFTTPLEIVTNRQAIMDLIGGMVFRRIVSIKTNGDMLIQVSSTGTRRKNAEGQYEAELPFYEPVFKNGKFVAVKAAGAKIAFNKHFYPLLQLIHADGKRIKTLERLNEMLKVEAWTSMHRKEVTLLGYRIPTQENNSMEFLQVAEFLPETFGACIIVPKEITTKAGSDFDVDKLNIFRPSYDKETGRVLGVETEAFYEKSLARVLKLVQRDERFQRIFEAVFNAEASDLDDEVDFDVQLGKMSDEDKRTVNDFRKAKRDYKYYLTNQAVEKYIRALSRPENFIQLITPNSTKTVKPLAESVALKAKRKGFSKKGVDNYVNTKIFEYTVNHIKYLQNVQGKNDLAMLALLNKMLQNIQQAGLLFNSKFNYTYSSPGTNPYTGEQEKRNITVSGVSTTPWLLTKEERETINRNGKWAVSTSQDVKGRTKQQIVSELMNATVDIAKDPFYIGLGINNFNKGVAGILLLQGVPIERVSYFLQQPILEEYYRRMTIRPYYVQEPREGEEELPDNLKKAFIATNVNAREMLGLRRRNELEQFIKNTQNEIKRAQFAKLSYDDIFSEEALLSKVGTTNWSSPDQQVIFGHFLAMQRLQKVYRMLQDLATTDTKKIATPLAAEAADLKKQDVINSGLFDQDSMNRLLTKSYTSPFTMKDAIRKVMATVMPTGFSSNFTTMVAKKIKDSDIYGTRAQMLRLEKTLANDFITYIMMNFGEYKGKPLKDFVGEMILRKKGNTIANRLTKMQKSYKKLFKHFALAELLHTNISTKQPLDNVELVRGLDNSSEMQDVLIQDFQKLVDFNTSMIPGTKYSKDSEAEIQDFFRDLAVVAFGQSGFNKSFLYMTDILPLKVMEPLLKKALKAYKVKMSESPEMEVRFIKEFLKDFGNNNPGLGIEGGLGKVNEEPQRGKYLKSAAMQKLEKKPEAPKQEQKTLPAAEQPIQTATEEPLKNRGSMQMQPDNIEKIKTGAKVVTNRTYNLKEGIYKLPDGTRVHVKPLGKARVIGDEVVFDNGATRSKDAFAKADGFQDWEDFVQNDKFSKMFIQGKQSRFIMAVSILGTQPIAQPLPSAPATQVPASKPSSTQVPAPVTPTPQPNSIVARFIKENGLKMFVPPATLSEDEKVDAYEKGQYFIPVTEENWQQALEAEAEDVVDKDDEFYTDLEEAFEEFRQQAEYDDLYDFYQGKISQKTLDFMVEKYPHLTDGISDDLPIKEAFRQIYIYEEYPSEEMKSEILEFLNKVGWRKEFDYNPAQFSLFQEDTLSKVIKKDNGKLAVWMGLNILEDDNQAAAVLVTDESIVVSPKVISERFAILKNTGSTINSVEDYYNYLIFKELTIKYMRTNPQESNNDFERRKAVNAIERLRHSKSPDAYSEVMLSIPAAFVQASTHKQYEEFSEQAKQMIAVFSKTNPNPTREELSALFDRLQCL